MQGAGCRVQSSGFRVQGSGFREPLEKLNLAEAGGFLGAATCFGYADVLCRELVKGVEPGY